MKRNVLKDLLKFIIVTLTRRGLRSVLTILGISIGIAAVVALISLSTGMQAGIEGEFKALGSDKLFVTASSSAFGPPGTSVVVPLTIDQAEGIEDIEGVDLAIGRLLSSRLAEFDDELELISVVSFPKEKEKQELLIEVFNYDLIMGKMLDYGSRDLLIGNGAHLNAFSETLFVRDTLVANEVEFEVVGIFGDTGFPERDNVFLLSESTMREVFDYDDEYDFIVVKVENENELPLVQERIQEYLRDERDVELGSEDFTVESPEALLATLNSVLAVVQGVLVGIASIALIVGSVGIMNTMYTSVVERRKEIGILRSLGVRRRMIQFLFLIESGILGFCGGFVGLILGVLAAKGLEILVVPFVGSALLQAYFSWQLFVGLLLISTVVGAVSGYFPAREASKITPLEALRT